MRKKIYLIEGRCGWGLFHSDIIKAKDEANAWTKLRWKHPFDVERLINITKIGDKD